MTGEFTPKVRKGLFKKIMIYFFIFLLVLCVAISLFIYIHPVFGGNPSDEQAGVYNKFDNYADGKFVLEVATKNGGASDSSVTSQESISGGEDRNPDGQIPVSEID